MNDERLPVDPRRGLSLRQRLEWLLATLIVFLAAVGTVGIIVSRWRTHASDVERDISVSAEQTVRLQSAYIDMETGQRGFIIGGSEVFLEPYRLGAATVDRLQTALLQNTANLSVSALDVLNTVVERGRAWRQQAEHELQVRRQDGQAAAEALIVKQVGRTRFDAVRAAVGELAKRLDAERETARAAREHRARQLQALLLSVPLAGLCFAALTSILINRWVVHPMRAMVAAVRKVTGGDLGVSVPSGGATDVAELGESINAMRQTMRDRLRESELAKEHAHRAREVIEQEAIMTLQLRAELASELGEFPEGWSAAADLLPAEGWVAGDCYDVTLVSPRLMGVIVLDIAGHGAVQAVIALKCKEILRAALRMAKDPGEALNLLADQIGEMHPSFLTAFVALIDTSTGTIRYANAGHPPALLAIDARVSAELGPTGPLLGAFPARWKTAKAMIEPGGKLAVYTDGLTEARDHGDAFYGMERLASIVVTLPCEVAESVMTACFEDLHSFSPARLVDDVTLVLICRSCED